jgi:ABC-type Na+ transport system ATPase subunit NatA
MIEARNLVKHYGATVAVNDLSFRIRPGMVTGFRGPNGAGKPVTGLRRSSSWRVRSRHPQMTVGRFGWPRGC